MASLIERAKAKMKNREDTGKLFSAGKGATLSSVVYVAVGRQCVRSTYNVTVSEAVGSDTPDVATKLGRKMLKRKSPPGWDDISCDGWRCIKLPVHDKGGCTSLVIVFGGDFDPKRAQATTERLALLLCPMLDGQLLDGDATEDRDRQDIQAADSARSDAEMREMNDVMTPILEREIEHANSMTKLEEVKNQVEQVKSIMVHNIEMILDRQEELEELDAKASQLADAGLQFRKKTRKLRRWHLMNQVKWGVAVGTLVTASVAIPIAILATA